MDQQTRGYTRGTPLGSGTIRHTGQSLSAKFQVLDISASGISIVMSADYEIGDPVSVKLEITDILFEKTIHFEGKVAKKSKTNSGFAYGIKITKMDKDDLVEIDEMIVALNTFNMNYSAGLMSSPDADFGINWLSNITDQGEKGEK
jgi:hypothetical protein